MSLHSIYSEVSINRVASYTNLLIGDIILFSGFPHKVLHTDAYGSYKGNRQYSNDRKYTIGCHPSFRRDITPSHSGYIKNLITSKEFYADWRKLSANCILNTKFIDITKNVKCTIYLNKPHKQYNHNYMNINNCFIREIIDEYIVFEQHSSGWAGILMENSDIVDSSWALNGKISIRNIDIITYK